MFINKDESHKDAGLLFLRIGVGIIFIIRGVMQLQGGPDEWAEMGNVFARYGVNFPPMLSGWISAFLELVGGGLLLLGVFARMASFLLLILVGVLLGMHLYNGDSFVVYSNAFQSCILFLSLLYIGPGNYTLGEWVLYHRR